MIQPTKVINEIPFLTSDDKATSLKRYLDSNEPRIQVPKSFIKNTLSQSQNDSRLSSFRKRTSPSPSPPLDYSCETADGFKKIMVKSVRTAQSLIHPDSPNGFNDYTALASRYTASKMPSKNPMD